ncbi:MAG: hypothetical protein U0Q15_09390 [Kineosporiaceae bacterium]
MTDLTALPAGLATSYLGLRLRSCVVASSSPLTRTLDGLKRLEDAGVGAVVLPSLYQEEVAGPGLSESQSAVAARAGLVADASNALDVPVIASLNAERPGAWAEYAKVLVEAGADALELNLYSAAADLSRSAEQVETDYLEAIADVRGTVEVPLAVKLSPTFSSLANFAQAAVRSGANGLVLFNRFYQPDVELDSMEVVAKAELSHPGELRLPLRWLGILRPQLRHGTSLAATSGIHSGADVAKAILVGADVACTASAVLRQGPEYVGVMLRELSEWLAANGYADVSAARGRLSAAGVGDPVAFERQAYREVLSSYKGD